MRPVRATVRKTWRASQSTAVHCCTRDVRIFAGRPGRARAYASLIEEVTMAVLVTAIVDGQTQEGWDQIFGMLGPVIRQAKGFIAVGGGHSHDGWRAFEIWESAQDATDFFAK